MVTYEHLTYTDNESSYLNVVYYDEGCNYPLDILLKDSLDYFGDNVLGECKQTTLNGMDVLIIRYSMVDTSVDEKEFNYYGYNYLLSIPYGVVDLDIYYSEEIIETKIVKPTKVDLELLQEIAQSFQVIE